MRPLTFPLLKLRNTRETARGPLCLIASSWFVWNCGLAALALCVVFAPGSLLAQKPGWQPSPDHTQVPIWPGTPPDAQFGAPPNTETAKQGEVDNVSRPT